MIILNFLLNDKNDEIMERYHHKKKNKVLSFLNDIAYFIFDEERRCYVVYRHIKHLIQKQIRGFSDRETWNLNDEFIHWFLPRLKRFREVSITHPIKYTQKEWVNILSLLIVYLELSVHEDYNVRDLNHKNTEKAIKIIHDNFNDFWW